MLTITKAELQLTEGAISILQGQLLATAAGKSAAELIWSTGAVKGGAYLLNGKVTSYFTQADVDAGLVGFRHDGGVISTLPKLTLSAGGEKSVSVTPVFAVTADNDAPALNFKAVTLVQGKSLVLNAALLGAKDEETALVDLVFSVKSSSHLLIKVAGVEASSFTVQQLISKQVMVTHDGSVSSPSLELGVSDGKQEVSQWLPLCFSAVSKSAPLPVLAFGGLSVAEAASVVLTRDMFSGTSGSDDAGLLFTASAKNAWFTLNGVKATSFTLAEVARGQVTFQHSGAEAAASFKLSLKSAQGKSAATSLNVSTGYIPVDDAPVISGVKPLSLLEGGLVKLGGSFKVVDGDTQVTNLSFSVVEVSGGQVELNGQVVTRFSASELKSVSFRHDGSEASPLLKISVSDAVNTQILELPFLFTRLNDLPEVEVTPWEMGINSSLLLTRGHLFAEDAENAAVTYQVNSSEGGSFLRDGVSVLVFSQADIDAGRVSYRTTSGTLVAEPVWTLRVSDGISSSALVTGTVSITPNAAPSGADKTIQLGQGSYVFSEADFGFSDVDGGSFKTLKINTLPASGQLLYNGKAVKAGQVFIAGSLDKLTYLADGANNSSFSFQVRDNQGVFNGGEDVDSSPNIITLQSNQAPSGSVVVSGSTIQGQVLSASHTLVDLDGLGEVSYTWQDGATVIGNASTLLLTQAQVGKSLSVTARYTDGKGTVESVTAQTGLVGNLNDAPGGSLSISGTAQQGQTLSVVDALSDVDGLGARSYTWKAGTELIGSGSSLLLIQAHVGKAISVSASYTDSFGAVESFSSAAFAPVTNVNDVPGGSLSISGSALQGQTLSVVDSLSDADGITARSYTWQSGGEVLGSGSSLLLTQAHVGKSISVTARYTDSFGAVEAVTSTPALVANLNDAPGGTLSISGTAQQGQTLNVVDSLSDVDGLGFRTYTWKAGSEVLGTGSILLLNQAHVGKSISVTASYTDNQGTSEFVTSSATTAVGNLNDAPGGSLTIGGSALQGQTLSVVDGLSDLDGLGQRSYTWTENNNVIATGSSLLLTQAHVGKSVRVTASYTDSYGSFESVTSSSTLIGNVNDAPGGTLSISGSALQGQTLNVVDALSDLDGIGFRTYTWKAGSEGIGTGSSVLLTQAQVGKLISVTASYTDSFGAVEAISASGAVVGNVNDAPGGTLTISGNAI